jgi:hypothetical protein
MKKSLLVVSAIAAAIVATVWLARGVDLMTLIKHLHGR